MNINKIVINVIKIPLTKPFKTALRSVFELETIIVRVKTRSGIVGYGETAPTFAITGDSTKSILEAINLIKKNLLGRSVLDFNELLKIVHNSVEKNFSAKSAMEIALYDIFAQNVKMPLYRMLGGSKKNFKTGITISLNEKDIMVQDSLQAVENGYKSLKIKLGSDYKEDIQRIEAISNVISKDISIKLDANQGWTPTESVKFLNAIEEKGISVELIEQPVKKDDLEGLKYIKNRTSIPLLADESVFSPKDAIRILEEEAVDFINIKLDKCGGISKAMLISDICKIYGVKCMIGCMLEGPISVGAAAHVASAKSDTITMLDLDAPLLCESLPVVGGAKFNSCDIELSDGYGLGIGQLKI